MQSDQRDGPMLDRPAQQEFGRIVRERLGAEQREELPGFLERLLQALRDESDDNEHRTRN